MKINICILLLGLLVNGTACSQETEYLAKPVSAVPAKEQIKVHSYPDCNIPEFFKRVVINHQRSFWLLDSASYLEFCAENNIRSRDTNNRRSYYTLKILHTLFTSKSAMNGSRGDVLNIPYLWHWVTPNPRHQIYDSKSGKRLKEIRPPKAFGKYVSFADIDRTPHLFLSDMVTGHNQYCTQQGDSFATFGWCSEREMAFVCLMKLLGAQGKVIAKGNHSWSELVITLKGSSGTNQQFIVIVDNTFDDVRWEKATASRMATWKAYTGRGKLSTWYNQKANSATEGEKVRNQQCDSITVSYIDKELVRYLRNQ